MIRVADAKFLISATSLADVPPASAAEVAFLGRSNVGKSSIINALVGRKSLAKSSSTPGKTRLINFFEVLYKKEEIPYKVNFVDLPGFGYAKVSKETLGQWEKNLTEFIKKREAIRLFVLLRDSRHPALTIDKEVKSFLKAHIRPDQSIIEVFTKIDKLTQRELAVLKSGHPDALFASSATRKGIDGVNEKIFATLFGG